MTDSDRILDGIRVVDLTTFVTGGFCSLMLANQGADVVKIERPGAGDDNRHSGPPFIDGESPYFWTVNYGKKSVELNLKSEAGREALYDLVSEADVFLQNYRPGTAERLDVDEETIRAHNEDIVYCAISAFGQTGPWRERPGYDLMIQGMSGIMSVTGEEDGRPVKVGLPMTDLITAMWAAFGVSNALYRRELTGEGEYIDLGMLDATLPWLTKQAGKVFAGESPSRMGTKDPVLAPYQTFETADGYINVACLNQKLWRTFCEAIDRPELADDERFETNGDRVEHMDELEAELEERLRELTTDEWMTLLVEDAGVPAGPVYEVEDALYNDQTEARGTTTTIEDPERGEIPVVEHPLNYDRADSGFESPPPQLGEHNRSVFADLGYDEDELDALEERGAFGDSA
ncbi:Crotonobetainyl-CoA:carnitine CoA-transferase CaiB [Halobiforma haloterrestris]|uniref:Crotonobetainyl-CoA:carnitine CoA-transferase CaiB n=1 Tax=Natronobacterium haloterrestre TaxID=148448 RepID=A0A1I1HXG5_NATHA|nr:CaiB/BaiF CoA-transferase family protein [Halobiforma haloterrestris]SFC28787.1 Crotonobetainyl-CoA:carnitine CoA-transferase CaiB [Halobiforma haloterrestris]